MKLWEMLTHPNDRDIMRLRQEEETQWGLLGDPVAMGMNHAPTQS